MQVSQTIKTETPPKVYFTSSSFEYILFLAAQDRLNDSSLDVS